MIALYRPRAHAAPTYVRVLTRGPQRAQIDFCGVRRVVATSALSPAPEAVERLAALPDGRARTWHELRGEPCLVTANVETT